MLENFYCTLQALPSIAKEVIEVLDILLRWFVLQFCKSNTTCLLKVHFSFFFNFNLYFLSISFLDVIGLITQIEMYRC